jgi:hypothetical protein
MPPFNPSNFLSAAREQAGQIVNSVADIADRSSRANFFFREQRAVNDLIDASDSFKRALDGNRAVQDALFLFQGNKVLKYPIDLGMNEEYRNILEIQIWANDPTALTTRRETLFSTGEQSIQSAVETNQSAGQNDGLDLASIAGNTVKSVKNIAQDAGNIAGSFIKTNVVDSKVSPDLVEVEVDATDDAGNPIPGQKVKKTLPVKIGSGDYSYVEESTGVAGLTKPIGSMYLYCPGGFETSYNLDYTDTEMGGNMELLRLPKAMAQNSETAKEIARSLFFNNIKDMELGGVKGEDAIKIYEAQSRIVKNPLQLHTFEKVQRRKFSFSFDMFPKSREELLSCHGIIHALKFWSHPRRSEGGRFLDYPGEFKLRFLNYDATENQYMPQLLRCALTSIKVKHGEDVVFSTFTKDDRGQAPTKFNLTLDFTELEMLTQDRFDQYNGSILVP